ncbi:hypothetical protein H6G04_16125 [Calothrix membranacea FACHB-236]|nr:hypothetical protein [Calothrix membranacea FACHB-236]MBD2213465.1 hypothetical protein [Nostoc linckia FACHB-104]
MGNFPYLKQLPRGINVFLTTSRNLKATEILRNYRLVHSAFLRVMPLPVPLASGLVGGNLMILNLSHRFGFVTDPRK